MNSIEIRPAVPGDAEAVAAYHRRCFERSYASQPDAGLLEPPDLASVERQMRAWFGPGSDFVTRIAVNEGRPVGHCTVRGNQLVHLFVDPTHQGTGLGRRLLDLGERLIAESGHSEFELHTRVENVAAIAFYERVGWTTTDRVITTTEHGITYDEIVLTKPR